MWYVWPEPRACCGGHLHGWGWLVVILEELLLLFFVVVFFKPMNMLVSSLHIISNQLVFSPDLEVR